MLFRLERLFRGSYSNRIWVIPSSTFKQIDNSLDINKYQLFVAIAQGRIIKKKISS